MFGKNGFEIIPVIDILNSKAVHAVEGKRSDYLPLKSYLFDSPNPQKIIVSLYKKFKFTKFYIADLDSIMYKNPNLKIINNISKNLPYISIILDPGIENLNDLTPFLKYNNINLILGLETIKNLNLIGESIDRLGRERIFVSIDMYNGDIFSKNPTIKIYGPLEIINKVHKLKVSNIILLDLSRVGQKIGGIPPLYEKIRKKFSENIFVGGGIKDIEDINLYHNNDFTGVLIGTALYDGTIKKKEIKAFFNAINQQ
jgi:phosphoribosylformimino-5-aminoimidazole carboxamide ribotide isomerase